MAPYDSDDSLDDDQDYTETDVLLGYASKEADGGETISKLGGRPDWLDPSQPPSYTHFKCASCASPLTLLLQLNAELAERFPGHERRLYVFACRKKACRRKDGSVRAVRATRVSAESLSKAKERKERAEREKAEQERLEAERKEKDKGLGEALFGVAKGTFGAAAGNANPFSTAGGGGASSGANPFAAKPAAATTAASANPFSTASPSSAPAPAPTPESKAPQDTATTISNLPKTFAETLSLNKPQPPSGPPPPPEPWPADADLPPPYPISYLAEAEYETLDPQPPPVPQATSMDLDDNNNNSAGGGSGGKEDKDVFESSIDSTFQKFADRLAQNPEQCIRYEFGGLPLLYAKTDAVGRKLHDVPAGDIGNVLPRCGHCGARRAFEVQLTPQAIVELEEGDGGEEDGGGGGGGSLEGMDWGAVIVAVCEGDCVPRGVEGEVGYVEEWVGVQWEELTSRR